MNYESEFILGGTWAKSSSSGRSMINLSSFIAFHARQTPTRCALKYRGEEISYAAFDRRIRTVGGWLRARGIGRPCVAAVRTKNSAAFLNIVFPPSHIGAIFLPIN